MKVDFKSAVLAVLSFSSVAITYLLDRSACLGLPGWALPVLTTAALAVNAFLPVIKRDT